MVSTASSEINSFVHAYECSDDIGERSIFFLVCVEVRFILSDGDFLLYGVFSFFALAVRNNVGKGFSFVGLPSKK